ncbi:MAG: hypothetical protein M4D80_16245 [Myxococcota bacterium]|nr:hypothetical protein [Myxococcota bacterium]
MGVAPIALFAYNRPVHVAKALRALSRCPELATSPLVIFCDGAKSPEAAARVEETRKTARELAPSHARIVERERNLGLAASIRTGVSELCAEHGRAIILEDDLEVSSTFLAFMNAALDRYADDPRVMQVSGYMYPADVRGPDDALFYPGTSCWGWGVWKRAWDQLGTGAAMSARLARDPALRARFDLDDAYPYYAMLQQQERGEVDSWGVGWYLDVFSTDGLVLYPRTSLVANRGHDGSGAHREQSSPFEADAHDFVARRWPSRLDAAQVTQLNDFIRRASRPGIAARVGRLLERAKGMLR